MTSIDRFRTADSLDQQKTFIINEWEKLCRKRIEASKLEGHLNLIDSLPKFLNKLSLTLRSPVPVIELEAQTEVAKKHGEERANQEFYSLEEVMNEYAILRMVLLDVIEVKDRMDPESAHILHAFLDIGIRKAVSEYLFFTKKKDDQKQLENDLIREKFVATLSHDLRTPMTTAKMSGQLIMRKLDATNPCFALAQKIVTSMDHADRMIQDLLDASRLKAGETLPLNIKECSMNQLASSMIDDLTSIYGPRFKLVAPHGDLIGNWDCSCVQRIIENLVGNALKYGDENGVITITLHKAKDYGEVSIHNTGHVIPLAEQENLFNLYRRSGKAESGKQKGWGIGLTLVKGLTEAHNGNVTIVSSEKLGTIFSVRLPYRPPKIQT